MNSVPIGPIVGGCVFVFVLVTACIFRFLRYSYYPKQIIGTCRPIVVGPQTPPCPIQSVSYRPNGFVVSDFSGSGFSAYPPYERTAYNGSGNDCYLNGYFVSYFNEGMPSAGAGGFMSDGSIPSILPPPFTSECADFMPPPPRYELVRAASGPNPVPLQNAARVPEGGESGGNAEETAKVREGVIGGTNERNDD